MATHEMPKRDMEYPSNSNKSKEADQVLAKNDHPKREKVISEDAIVQKSGGKLKRFFTGERAREVYDYLIHEVLLPSLKETLDDSIDAMKGAILWNDATRGSNRGKSSGNYTVYRKSYVDEDRRARRTSLEEKGDRRSLSNIILRSKNDAEHVIYSLSDIIEEEGVATVTDLWQLLDVQGEFTDNYWGWHSVASAKIRTVRGGYLLLLPDPRPLNFN